MPTGTTRIWFPLYAADLLADAKVAALTFAQERHLVRLWCFYWRDGPLPSDTATLARMLGGADPADVEALVGVFFTHNPRTGLLHSSRMDREKSAADANYRSRVETVRRLNKSKRGNKLNGDRSDNRHDHRTNAATETAPPSPSPTPTTELSSSVAMLRRHGLTEIADLAPPVASAAAGFLAEARRAPSRAAVIRAVAEGMPGHGPGFGWPAVGQALLELAATNGEFSEPGLRSFARHVRDRKPERKYTTVVDELSRTRPAYLEGNVWHFTDSEGGTMEVPSRD